jgi:beta-lactamase regulating signal transducer with metallopeptidase domain
MLWWLAQNSATCAILALLVFLLTRWSRVSPALRHALWLIVLIKLATPTFISWPWQVPNISRTVEAPQPAVEVPLAANDSETALVWLECLPETQALEPFVPPEWTDFDSWAWFKKGSGTVVGSTLRAVPARVPDPFLNHAWSFPEFEPAAIGMALWLAGALGLLGIQTARIIRFQSKLRHAEAAPPWLQRLVDEQASELGIRSPVTQVVSGLSTPCIWAWGRPRLLCPAGLLEELSAGEWRSVIVHELAHLRRRDHWTAWLLLWIGCAYWWNPLYWLVRRQIQTSAELACDAWVVGTLPGERRVYAEALLQVTQMVSRTRVPVPALGMSGARRIFERRLTMIMRDRVPCRLSWAALGAVLILALVALPGWSKVDDEPKKQKKDLELTLQVEPASTEFNPFVFVYDDDKKLAAPAGDERERRLQALEKQVQALLREVRALRGEQPEGHDQVYRFHATPKASTITVRPVPAIPATPSIAPVPALEAPTAGYSVVPAHHQLELRAKVVRPREMDTEDVVVNGSGDLIAKKYKLPRSKAEKLAAFLTDNVPGLEQAKVEKDGLTVIGTKSAVNAIQGMVKLMAEQTK